jgi:hypothetical protein
MPAAFKFCTIVAACKATLSALLPRASSRASCSRIASRIGTMPRVSLAELWPREANLALAQAHARGGSAVTIAQQLNRQRGSSAYTPRLVGDQVERLRLNPTRQSQATTRESWQPDAVALLTSPQAQGMTTQQLAELIYRETGQVSSCRVFSARSHAAPMARGSNSLKADSRAATRCATSGQPTAESITLQARSLLWLSSIGNYAPWCNDRRL